MKKAEEREGRRERDLMKGVGADGFSQSMWNKQNNNRALG